MFICPGKRQKRAHSRAGQQVGVARARQQPRRRVGRRLQPPGAPRLAPRPATHSLHAPLHLLWLRGNLSIIHYCVPLYNKQHKNSLNFGNYDGLSRLVYFFTGTLSRTASDDSGDFIRSTGRCRRPTRSRERNGIGTVDG